MYENQNWYSGNRQRSNRAMFRVEAKVEIPTTNLLLMAISSTQNKHKLIKSFLFQKKKNSKTQILYTIKVTSRLRKQYLMCNEILQIQQNGQNYY